MVKKLEETLNLEFWNVKERQHIRKLISLLKQNECYFYDNRSDSDHDVLYIATYKWAKYGVKEFCWSPKLIAAIVANPNKLISKAGLVENASDLTTRADHFDGSATEMETCECNTLGEYALFDDCKNGCFGTALCKKTTWRCGLFFGDPCNGMCY